MKKTKQVAGRPGNKKRIQQAEARAEQAEARTEQAKTRTERAEARTEFAKTRTEQAETRSDQAETTLQRVVRLGDDPRAEAPMRLLHSFSGRKSAGRRSPIDGLTGRQRRILQLIAESRNTKQIAEILQVSPKTIEYHRAKLMKCLNVHDVPGLVRFALRSGLVSQDG
jgi:DNA-binding CsgD family transcriptional regulator